MYKWFVRIYLPRGNLLLGRGDVERQQISAPFSSGGFSKYFSSPLPYTDADGNTAEEQRVEDALNQSMVSAFSISGASSMSASGTVTILQAEPTI